MNTTIPAQLWIGNKAILHARVEEHLKKELCLHNFQESNCFCNSCKNIGNRQHRLVRWICPEHTYVVDDLEPLFHSSSFTLDAHEQFFFILEKAHTLTTTTANRLLKLLEEPPLGYHFILLSSTAEAIIPTIRSRCALIAFSQTSPSTTHPLLKHFLERPACRDVFSFEQEITHVPHESETQELLSTLLAEFSTGYQTSQNSSEQDYYQRCIAHIQNHSTYLPQPGSAALFWKHFFLTFPHEK